MTSSGSSSYQANDGAAYERFLGRWTALLATELAGFARLPSDGPVLDVGTGTGALAAEIAGRDHRRSVVGVDVSRSYLDFARTRHIWTNLRFESGDALALPFPPGTFAACVAQLVLNFVSDPYAAIREMVRVTRPGGTIAAAVWDFCGGLVYQRIFWDTAAAMDLAAAAARDRLFSHPLATPEGLKEIWLSAGIGLVEIGSLTIRMDYADFDDYWEPLLGGQGPVGTFIPGMKPDDRERLKTTVRAAFLAGRPDGARSLTATAWAVRGLVSS